jgi:NAD(P) transhydrogenase
MSLKKYDLIVIGSGPAGEKGAAQAAYFGKKVALVEKEPVMGGAAANTGTIPAKTLRETALYLSGFRQRGLYGVNLSIKEQVTVPDFMFRERVVKESERSRVLDNLRHHKVDLYSGEASFAGPHTMAVRPPRSAEVRIEGEHILIATGSSPFRPSAFPFHDMRVYDSDTILTMHGIPSSMLVVGGGVIGCVFAALGIKVTLVEGRDRIVGFLDHEIADSLAKRMRAMGVEIRMPDTVESVETGEQLQSRLASGASLDTDTILVASGRTGNTGMLGLDGVGIAVGQRGHLPVNAHYQTNLPHVYAAGDVIGTWGKLVW